MTIKLPKKIRAEFEAIRNDLQKQSPRIILNTIMNSGFKNLPNLYHYLFNSKGTQHNQLKFLNAFYGQEYIFDDEKFNYKTSDDQYIGFNMETKMYFTCKLKTYDSEIFKMRFTRDEILDSPFDINKLTEIKIK